MSRKLACTKISQLLILSQGESKWSILKLLTAEAYETYFIQSIFNDSWVIKIPKTYHP
jgi:hypothetical protein